MILRKIFYAHISYQPWKILRLLLKKKNEQDLLEFFFTKTSSALEISYESTDTPCPRTFDLAPIRTAITVLNETKK